MKRQFTSALCMLIAATCPVAAAEDAPPQAPAPKPPPLAIAPFEADQAARHQAAWAEYLGVPVEKTNSIGMKLALIPPGEFMMGREEPNRHPYEKPQHEVQITKPFFLGVHEVTQGEWKKVMAMEPWLEYGDLRKTSER